MKKRHTRYRMRSQLNAETRQAIHDNVLDYISGSYRAWRHRRQYNPKEREPCITTGEVADYLRQHTMTEDFRWATKREQYSWTRSVMESLRRRGKLRSSLGSAGGRREVRCYEPGER